MKANFQAGIGLGQTVRSLVTLQDDYRITIQLETDGTPAAWIEVSWSPLRNQRADTLPKLSAAPKTCRERSIEEVTAASGNVALYIDGDLAGGLFPNLIRVLPPMQIAALLATTRLVGMECPGYHSIYSSLSLVFFSAGAGVSNLYYHVAECNQRLALISMDVEAPGIKGQIKAISKTVDRKI